MNADGRRDMITGHYWPGDIFVFWATTDGKFARVANLKDSTGRNLNAGEPWESEETPRMESLAAAPWATDFDGDGDYDMLIGNIVGEVILMRNEGTPRIPRFSTHRVTLTAGGEKIQVPKGDAGPVHADWDSDGKRDLIVGAGDGSVWFYRNIGEDDAPDFAKGRVIVAKLPRQYNNLWQHDEEPTWPGIRAKVCVTDYNRDGHVDLLVGGFSQVAHPDPILTAKQVLQRDELREKHDTALKKRGTAYAAGGDRPTAEQQAEIDKLSLEYSAILEELQTLEAHTSLHGWVWLFLRRNGADR